MSEPAKEHRLLGLPVFLVYGGAASALDLVIAAGVSRAASPDLGFAVFVVVFIAFAVVAAGCSDWILQRATRRHGGEA
jgi:hypothetical protein